MGKLTNGFRWSAVDHNWRLSLPSLDIAIHLPSAVVAIPANGDGGPRSTTGSISGSGMFQSRALSSSVGSEPTVTS